MLLERWPSWSMAHAWKVCIPQKGIMGSNPILSAEIKIAPLLAGHFFLLEILADPVSARNLFYIIRLRGALRNLWGVQSWMRLLFLCCLPAAIEAWRLLCERLQNQAPGPHFW